MFIPLSFLVAQKLNRQTPGAVALGDGPDPLATTRGWFAVAAVLVELLLLGVIKTRGIELLGNGTGGSRRTPPPSSWWRC